MNLSCLHQRTGQYQQGNVSNAINFVESVLAKGLTLAMGYLRSCSTLTKSKQSTKHSKRFMIKLILRPIKLIDWLKDKRVDAQGATETVEITRHKLRGTTLLRILFPIRKTYRQPVSLPRHKAKSNCSSPKEDQR